MWGAPIDAATEHALYRADLLAEIGGDLPVQWSDVLALGRKARAARLYLGIALVTPHAGLFVAALMANGGNAWTTEPGASFEFAREPLVEALDAIVELASLCPPKAAHWNSIDLHEAMVARDDIVYAPCVYGYATYGEADMRRRLSFADFPCRMAPFAAGSAIGGTALGVSAQSRSQAAAIDFVRFVLSAEAQDDIIPAHHGQPARRSAWSDPAVDARFNFFFGSVRRSMEQAWIRPRFAGYIPFQHRIGEIITAHIGGTIDRAATIASIIAAARQAGSGR